MTSTSVLHRRLETIQGIAALVCGLAACAVTFTAAGRHLRPVRIRWNLAYVVIELGGGMGRFSERRNPVASLFLTAAGYLCYGVAATVVTDAISSPYWPLWLCIFAVPSLLISVPGMFAGNILF